MTYMPLNMTHEESHLGVTRVARAIYESQFDERFDDLNPKGIDRALYEQIARAALIECLTFVMECWDKRGRSP